VKIVVTADIHIHPWRLCSRDGGHDRLMDGLSVLRQSLGLAAEHRAAWVFAGDLKQPKRSWPQDALTGVHEVLRDEEYEDVQKVMVCGNHDARGEGGTGLSPFKDCATVVEHADIVELDDPDGADGGQLIVCAPWDADLEVVRRYVKDGHPLVAHGFLQGCMLGTEDVRIAKGTPVSEYGDFSVAFFGDVHKAQWRHPGDPKTGRPPMWYPFSAEGFNERDARGLRGAVFYAGSPYQQNWGERDDPPKGALLADLATGEVSLCPLKAPRYRHFELDERGIMAWLDCRPSDYEGDFVRIVYTGKPCSALDEARKIGDQFRSFQIIPRRVEKTERRADIHAGMPVEGMIRGYVAAHPPVDLDPDKTVEAMVRLASE